VVLASTLAADVGTKRRGSRFTVTGCMLADGRVGNGRDRSSRVSMASSSSPRVGCSCLYLAFLLTPVNLAAPWGPEASLPVASLHHPMCFPKVSRLG